MFAWHTYIPCCWSIDPSFVHTIINMLNQRSSKTIKEHFLALAPLHGMQSPKAQLRPWMKFWMKILNSWGCRDQGWSRLNKAQRKRDSFWLRLVLPSGSTRPNTLVWSKALTHIDFQDAEESVKRKWPKDGREQDVARAQPCNSIRS